MVIVRTMHLLKRRILIQSGWPRGDLLLTVVRGDEDEAHMPGTEVGYAVSSANNILVRRRSGFAAK